MRDTFDKFATKASDFAADALAFALAVLILLLWAPSILVVQNIDTWQLVINTLTTIITFCMVFLIQHAQKKFELATNLKLDEILRAIKEADDSFRRAEDRPDTELRKMREQG